jgi:hypothetical protein
MNNEELTRRKIRKIKFSKLQNFFFFFFGPLLLSNLIIFFSFFFILNVLECYKHHLKFYKPRLNYNSNKTT